MQVTRMTLTDAWDRLCAVRSFRFSAESNDRTSGWNGTGSGTVKVTVIGNSTITFTEHGTWAGDSGRQLDFRNIYRWRFDWDADAIRLEHLGHDPNRPVFLLALTPIDEATFESVSPHRCGPDIYTATGTMPSSCGGAYTGQKRMRKSYVPTFSMTRELMN